jgi:signal peptidase I
MIGFLIFDSGFLIPIADRRSEIENLSDAVLDLSQQANQRIWWPFVGTSMSPYIKEGDMLLVQHALHPIRLGDVIVFKRAGGLIAHRVVFIRKHGNHSVYRTKGDNTRSLDAPVLQSSVLGRVVRIQKSNKSISLEKPHAKLLNFVLALSSYAMGIFCKFAIFGYRLLIPKWKATKEDV